MFFCVFIERKEYNEKIDNWGMGIIFYMVICGYRPFNGKTHKELFHSILKDDPCFDPSKYIVWAHVSQQCQSLISHLLRKHCNLRKTPNDVLQLNTVFDHSQQNSILAFKRFFYFFLFGCVFFQVFGCKLLKNTDALFCFMHINFVLKGYKRYLCVEELIVSYDMVGHVFL